MHVARRGAALQAKAEPEVPHAPSLHSCAQQGNSLALHAGVLSTIWAMPSPAAESPGRGLPLTLQQASDGERSRAPLPPSHAPSLADRAGSACSRADSACFGAPALPPPRKSEPASGARAASQWLLIFMGAGRQRAVIPSDPFARGRETARCSLPKAGQVARGEGQHVQCLLSALLPSALGGEASTDLRAHLAVAADPCIESARPP